MKENDVENNDEVVEIFGGDFLVSLGDLVNGIGYTVNEFNDETQFTKIIKIDVTFKNENGGELRTHTIDVDPEFGIGLIFNDR
jgi:hypothetical protein